MYVLLLLLACVVNCKATMPTKKSEKKKCVNCEHKPNPIYSIVYERERNTERARV